MSTRSRREASRILLGREAAVAALDDVAVLTTSVSASAAILYKLKLDQSVTTIPTVGFNVESFTYKKVKFNVWVSGKPCNFTSCA